MTIITPKLIFLELSMFTLTAPFYVIRSFLKYPFNHRLPMDWLLMALLTLWITSTVMFFLLP